MAVAALVLGIVGLVFAFIPGLNFVGGIAGIIAIILGALGRKQLKAQSQPTGTATAGLVMGIISTVLGVLLYILCVAAVAGVAKMGEEALKDPKLQEQFKKELEKGMKEKETEK
jgi:hypothetical protein